MRLPQASLELRQLGASTGICFDANRFVQYSGRSATSAYKYSCTIFTLSRWVLNATTIPFPGTCAATRSIAVRGLS